MTKFGVFGTCAAVLSLGALLTSGTGARAHEITQAQAELPKAPLTITDSSGHAHHFSVEVAKTGAQKEVGEMFRTNVPDHGGMLFTWTPPREVNMWMRNTLVPLDMVFIGPDRRIIAIEENTVPESEAVISSHGVAAYTLELRGGATRQDDIAVGDRASSPVFDETGKAPAGN